MLVWVDGLGFVGFELGVHIELQLPLIAIGIRPFEAEIQLMVFFKNEIM
jgi:hypothetical protein